MTVSTTTSTVTYIGNGATTVFTFPFIGVSSDDLQVILTDTNTGDQVILPTYQYTLVINPVPTGGLWGIGGSVTYPIAGSPITSDYTITITRDVPYEQNVSISNQGAFYPGAVEQGLDLLEMQIQQILDSDSYAIRAPTTDPQAPSVLPPFAQRENKVIGFDDTGMNTVMYSSTQPLYPPVTVTTRKIDTGGTNTVIMNSNDLFGGVSVYQTGVSDTSVQLPSSGGLYPVFDGGGNAGTYPIKVLPPVGKTILGQTEYFLAFNFQSATFYNDGYQILVQ